MKKQTAVEWLENELSRIGLTHEVIGDKIKQALAMEKEQIAKAYYIGANDESDRDGAMYKSKEDAEQYYNETYGQ